MGGFDQASNVINGITEWGSATTAQFAYAGDPNGHVTAQNAGDLCIDTDTPALYQAPGNGTVWDRIGAPDTDQWGAASAAQFSYAGDPNGHVAALGEGDLCVDTATPALYQAPGAGTVWTLITPPIILGQGKPIGVVTPPSIGAIYLDAEFGVAYFAANATSDDWFSFAGAVDPDVSGVYSYDGEARLQDGEGSYIDISSSGITIQPSAAAGVAEMISAAADGGGVLVSDDGAGNTEIGLYNATEVVQPDAIPAPAGGAMIDAEARTAITAILAAIGAAAGGIGITK